MELKLYSLQLFCLGFATFGSFGKMLVDFSIIVSQVGTLEPYSLGIDDLLSLSLHQVLIVLI